MLSTHPLGITGLRLARSNLMHPRIQAGLKWNIATGSLVDNDVLNDLATTQCQSLINNGLQGQGLTTAHLLIGSNDGNCARINDALLQRLRRESTKHDRVCCANPSTGLHRHHTLDRHRHINDDAVTLFNSALTQGIR